AGATALANLSASNVTVGKWEFRRELVTMSAARNLAVQLYSAAGFGEATAGLCLGGPGMIAHPRGVLAGSARFARGGETTLAPAALLALSADRARQTSFGQNAATAGGPVRRVRASDATDLRPAAVYATLRRRIDPTPFVPADPARRDE